MSWWIFLLTLVPFLELRVSLPTAVAAGFPLGLSLFICVLLNLAVIPVAFFILDRVVPPLRRRLSIVDRVYRWSLRRAARHRPAGIFGLFLFVAVPLPGTGAYSGCLAAHVFCLPRKPASLAISLGVIGAALLISAVSWFSLSLI